MPYVLFKFKERSGVSENAVPYGIECLSSCDWWPPGICRDIVSIEVLVRGSIFYLLSSSVSSLARDE